MQKPISKISVTNIQHLCVHDGPGVRTVVFLRGCTLQCPWCCNPEAIHVGEDIRFDKGTCTYPQENRICRDCEKFDGKRSMKDCPIGAYEPSYRDYSIEELSDILLRDKSLYDAGGGVTFSGGEPLLYIQNIVPVLKKLKEQNIHIAFETTLYVPTEKFEVALQYADYWLVDLKFQFGYIRNREFDVPDGVVIQNLKRLQESVEKQNITYRMVYMHEAAKKISQIVNLLLANTISELEILECHSLAENKYRQLGQSFHKFTAPTEDDLSNLEKYLTDNNIKINISKL